MNDRLSSFAAGIGFAGIVRMALSGNPPMAAVVDALTLVLSLALVVVGVLDWWYDRRA